MKIRDAIIRAIGSADDAVRQYGEGGIPREERYADSILSMLAELSCIDDVEKLLEEHARYRRALEYIAQAPVSTETEIVLQGRAMVSLLTKENVDDDD